MKQGIPTGTTTSRSRRKDVLRAILATPDASNIEIGKRIDLSFGTVSQYRREFEKAGLVQERGDISIKFPPAADIAANIERIALQSSRDVVRYAPLRKVTHKGTRL